MSRYPIFLELKGRRVVLIGAGAVALRKAQSLLAAGARLVVVADDIDELFEAAFAGKNAKLIKAKYSKQYLAEALFAIAATGNRELNREIATDCRRLGVLCNTVDDPENCDFFVPAIVKRGDLQIAIGTNGKCPAYAGHIRKKLEKIFTDRHAEFLAELAELRTRIIADVPDPAQRKSMLGKLVNDESLNYFLEHGQQKWRKRTENIITEYQSP